MNEPTAAPAVSTVQPGMDGADENGRLHVSSQPLAPTVQNSEAAKDLALLRQIKADPAVIEQFIRENPDVAETKLSEKAAEIEAQFPSITDPSTIDMGYPPDLPNTPEIAAAKAQMGEWVKHSGGTSEMIAPMISAINATAPIAAMSPSQQEIHMQVERDKIVRAVGGEDAYKQNLSEARQYLNELEARAPGIKKFITDNPHVVDGSALVQSQLFMLAKLAKARRGSK